MLHTYFTQKAGEEEENVGDAKLLHASHHPLLVPRKLWNGQNLRLFFLSRAGPVILELKELCSPQTHFLNMQQYWGTQA